MKSQIKLNYSQETNESNKSRAAVSRSIQVLSPAMTATAEEKKDMPRASHFSFSKGWFSRRPESSKSWSWNWELSGRNKNLVGKKGLQF